MHDPLAISALRNSLMETNRGNTQMLQSELRAITEACQYRTSGAGPLHDDEAVLEGHFRLVELRRGLTLHATDACDLQDLKVEMIQDEGITFQLFLKGGARAQFGSRMIEMGSVANRQLSGPEAIAIPRAHPELFRRHSLPGVRVRKVNVSVTPEWLEDAGFGMTTDHRAIRQFATRHLKCFRWKPTAKLIAIGNEILDACPYSPSLERLFLEGRALDFVIEALAALSGRTCNEPVADRRRSRAIMVRDYIDAHLDKPITLDAIARETGMSINTIQRHFQQFQQKTVFEYVKDRKMQQARRALLGGLSIAQAAHQAGYASAANFATAFKRHFGISPKGARSGSA